VYWQPRSTVCAEGVFTINRPGGAQINA
jgi:hypothetical protein